MRASVLVPTYNRAHLHERLFAMFESQTHPDLELVVLDDSDQPSAFFTACTDPRVRYIHRTGRMNIGAKRNALAEFATGDVLVHFDDDDYYAPKYVEFMLSKLGSQDMAKLVGFFAYSQTHDMLAYWDLASVFAFHFKVESGAPVSMMNFTDVPREERDRWMALNLFGYGFSMVYRKRVFEKVQFKELTHGEDAQFVLDADAAGMQVNLLHDDQGIAVVLRHAADHSIIYPQYNIPAFLVRQLFGDIGVEALTSDLARVASPV